MGRRIRVLHLEDDPRDAEIVRNRLEADGVRCHIVQVDRKDSFASALAEHSFDLILCDYHLPDFNGLAALRLAQERRPGVPVIIITGVMSDEEAVACLRAGATDYVLKDRVLRLASAVTRAIREAKERRLRGVAEAALRESQERFEQLAEKSREGFWFVALNPERILYVSPAVETIWGLSAESFYQDPRVWLGAIHADDRTRVQEAWVAWAKDPTSRFFEECRIIRPDGSVRWVLNSGTPIRNETGVVTRLSGLTTDITERKQAEELLRQSEAFSRAVLNSLSYHIAVLDAQGTIIATNQAWQVFASENGGNQHAIHPIGTNYLSVVEESIRGGDATAQAALDGIRGVLSGARETFVLEYPCHSPDKQLWFAMRVRPMNDLRGGVVVTHQNITERMEFQAKFYQAQKMETVGLLAGGVAHDFNNLLTVINGVAELALAQLKEGDPLRADLEEIHNTGERAAVLTHQLLAFSRKQVLQPAVLNLNAVIAKMESMLRRLIGEDINLVADLAPGLGSVKADPGEIEQVIANLAVNARDAMPHGGKLTIETRDVELDEDYPHQHGVAVRPGPYVMLMVTDSGIGMDEATRTQIFEPFFTTKASGAGTGLGLSTVYGIVKQSGGLVWAYSEVGQGTSFKIYLPRVAEVAGPALRHPTVAPARGAETILVVEDVEGLRKLAARMLESVGYTVLTAADGEEALHLLERVEEPVHLMLTDVVMPGLSGPNLASQSGRIRPEMQVLYMSGYTDDVVVRNRVLNDELPFISKPFSVVELTRKVREVLDSKD